VWNEVGSFPALCKSAREIGISSEEIPISLADLPISLAEIPISLGEIPISARGIGKFFSPTTQPPIMV